MTGIKATTLRELRAAIDALEARGEVDMDGQLYLCDANERMMRELAGIDVDGDGDGCLTSCLDGEVRP